MNNTKYGIQEVCELLTNTVPDVLETMFSMEALAMPPGNLQSLDSPLVVASVGFIGDLDGIVHLYLTAAFSRVLAARLLSLADHEFEGNEMIDDAIGELGNMIVGAVKSRLCDDGAPCILTIPTIVRGNGLRLGAPGMTDHRSIGFRCGDEEITLELLMKAAGGS